VQCGDVEVEKKIEKKISQFIAWAEKHPNRNGQICLSFYEVKNKQVSWFGNKVERHHWEQWYINLHILQPKFHVSKSHHSKHISSLGDEENWTRHTSALEVSLREVLFQIIKFANEKRDHIPSIPNLEGVSFPYEISLPSSSDSSFGMDMLMRMLQTGHPSMLS